MPSPVPPPTSRPAARRAGARRRLAGAAVALALGAGIAAAPRPAAAFGIPTIDKRNIGAALGQFLAEWLASYKVLAQWRDKLTEKTKQGNDWMDKVDNTRMAIEQNADGELVGFGRKYIDLEDFKNNELAEKFWDTAFDGAEWVDSTTRRAQGLRDKFVRKAESYYAKQVRTLFRDATKFAAEYRTQVGETLADITGDTLAQSAFRVLARGAEWQRLSTHEMLEGASEIEARLVTADSLLGDLERGEGVDSVLVSGRADQLSGVVTLQQTKITNELVRAQALTLKNKALNLARRNRGGLLPGSDPAKILTGRMADTTRNDP